MTSNVLHTPFGQLGLVLLFIVTLAVLVRLIDKRARKRRRKKKQKLRS